MDREYITSFPDGTQVRWKPLTWSEFKELQKNYNILVEEYGNAAEWLLHEAAAASCVIDQEQNGEQVEFDDLYAGTVYIVGGHIIRESGFVNDAEVIKKRQGQARETFGADWYEQVMSYIMFFFKKSEDEVREWTIHKFMEYSARVETLLGSELEVLTEKDLEEQAAEPKIQYRTLPNGRKVPVVTKRDVSRKRNIDFEKDNMDLGKI